MLETQRIPAFAKASAADEDLADKAGSAGVSHRQKSAVKACAWSATSAKYISPPGVGQGQSARLGTVLHAIDRNRLLAPLPLPQKSQ